MNKNDIIYEVIAEWRVNNQMYGHMIVPKKRRFKLEIEKIYDELIKKINPNQIFKNEPMKKHTSFKIRWTSRYILKTKKYRRYKIRIYHYK